MGGSGVLSFQQTFFSQGSNPFRILVDGQGNYLYVLDAVAPSGVGMCGGAGADGNHVR